MVSKYESMKCFRDVSGLTKLSKNLLDQIEKCHAEQNMCFLCLGAFHQDPYLKHVEGSNWSQVFPFMEKFGIPKCLIGTGSRYLPIMKDFVKQVDGIMEDFGLTPGHRFSTANYSHFDIEKLLLRLMTLIEFCFEKGFIIPPDFAPHQKIVLKTFQLDKWPTEIDDRVHFQAAALTLVNDVEEKILRREMAQENRQIIKALKTDMKKEERENAAEKLTDARIEKIAKKVECIKKSKKVKIAERKQTEKDGNVSKKSNKPRIVRTKFNKAPKPLKTSEEDKPSIEANKFHRRYRKTKRNVRV